jgi:hypothetical protein
MAGGSLELRRQRLDHRLDAQGAQQPHIGARRGGVEEDGRQPECQ